MVINQNQGAFIQNKSIAHSILIFQDLIKNYGRKNTLARCAIKIDLSKAYNTVSWDFLEKWLNYLCFPSRFVNWIMLCIRSTSYNLVLNGRLQESFEGKKGLRQGDAMSPLLFVLVMEFLTRRLHKEAEKGTFKYHPQCKSLNLVNLSFADDLILFSKGTQTVVRHLKTTLDDFCNQLGLSVNLAKSQIFFGGVQPFERKKIAQEIGLEEGSGKTLKDVLMGSKWKEKQDSYCFLGQELLGASYPCPNIDFSSGSRKAISVFTLIVVIQRKLLLGYSAVLDLWLSNEDNPRVTLNNLALIDQNVKALIETDTLAWDVDLVHDMFNERDANLILSIFLSSSRLCDVWYWSWESSGHFSVKLVYKFLQLSKELGAQDDNSVFWNTLWKLCIPPKVKDLLWRAATNCLPTKSRLRSRHVPVDTICPVCKVTDETIYHCLVDCSFAKACWQQLATGVNLTAVGSLPTGLLRFYSRRMGRKRDWTRAQDSTFNPTAAFLTDVDDAETWAKPAETP
ncbi:uncharacterized protein LOC133031301 [Cannabis sativa]|uniref:uncharacterized protein LOC133031301 n=1 Tax=Cannabis sativa TaxID=3483 RepID=UPI0029C9B3CA|nr:uncharacterized protein LOC133031301 [Cannabis sativa]